MFSIYKGPCGKVDQWRVLRHAKTKFLGSSHMGNIA